MNFSPDDIERMAVEMEAFKQPSREQTLTKVQEAHPGWTVKKESTERWWSARSPTFSEDGVQIWAPSPAGLIRRIAKFRGPMVLKVDSTAVQRIKEAAGNPSIMQGNPKMPRSFSQLQGYTGDPCGECQALTLRHNGTCLLCDSCGATSGCS